MTVILTRALRAAIRRTLNTAALGALAASALCSQAIAASAAPDAAATAPASGTAKKGAAATPSTMKEEDKMIYELGVLLSGNLDSFQLSESEFKLVNQGFADGYHHRADIAEAAPYQKKLGELMRTRLQAQALHEKQLGGAYIKKVAAMPGATQTGSGMVYVPLAEGTGPSPAMHDQVKLNYSGKLIDGTVFDSSAEHGQPLTLIVGSVIPCFNEALQKMKVGGKARIVCPAELAYGDRGIPPKIKPGSTLEFEVELLEVTTPAAAAPASPPAVSPPASSPAPK